MKPKRQQQLLLGSCANHKVVKFVLKYKVKIKFYACNKINGNTFIRCLLKHPLLPTGAHSKTEFSSSLYPFGPSALEMLKHSDNVVLCKNLENIF